MLLAIDIGNTTTGLAVIRPSGRIESVTVVDTKAKIKQIRAAADKIMKTRPVMVKGAVICSVVPEVSKVLEDALQRKIPVRIIGRDITVPVKNLYRNPRQVGQDRLVGAYAAMKIYGRPLIVVDLGTAITFDVVSARGEYMGGAIVPGLRLSAESLFQKTALIPKIGIHAPGRIIGRTTEESILSGLFFGYGSMCRGFIDLISRQLKVRPKVVMTGGYTRLMKKFVSPKIRIIDEDLVFKGIYLLSQQ